MPAARLTAHSATTLRITGTVITGNTTRGQWRSDYSLISNPYLSVIDFDAMEELDGDAVRIHHKGKPAERGSLIQKIIHLSLLFNFK